MLKRLKRALRGVPHVPEAAQRGILHISDTPRAIYPWIKCLIKESNPSYIIHTGDVADDIKLELAPTRLKTIYQNAIIQFKEMIRGYEGKVYIVYGNHDDKSVLESILKQAIILQEPSVIQIENLTLHLSHKPYPIKDNNKYDFIMFGHAPIQPKSDNHLNGLLKAHIITIKRDVYEIPYPKGTNKYRKLRWGGGHDLIHRGP